MKKFLPFLFPLIALLIIFVLIFRWYNAQTSSKQGKIPDFADGTSISELSPVDNTKLRKGAKDVSTVEMQGSKNETGEIRYEIKDGKVQFSVIATLPVAKDASYQVWLQDLNGSSKKKAFTLEVEKGGYVGSGSISADVLPFEVVVSQEKNNDNEMELPLLRGVIQKESTNQK